MKTTEDDDRQKLEVQKEVIANLHQSSDYQDLRRKADERRAHVSEVRRSREAEISHGDRVSQRLHES